MHARRAPSLDLPSCELPAAAFAAATYQTSNSAVLAALFELFCVCEIKTFSKIWGNFSAVQFFSSSVRFVYTRRCLISKGNLLYVRYTQKQVDQGWYVHVQQPSLFPYLERRRSELSQPQMSQSRINVLLISCTGRGVTYLLLLTMHVGTRVYFGIVTSQPQTKIGNHV